MVSPRRLSAPASAPRTEWACQSVAVIISAMLAPPGRARSAASRSSLLADAGRDGLFGGTLALFGRLPGFAGFGSVFTLGISGLLA